MADPLIKQDRIYTYGDYRSWPDDERWELIEGTAWNMTPAPRRIHQKVSGNLFTQISNSIHGSCEVYAAPFDVLLPGPGQTNDNDVTTVVQPDISVICDVGKLTEKGCTGAPDWVVEIISPATSKKDFNDKLKLYEQHGVREYWIVDPGNHYLHVYLLTDGKYPDAPVIYLEDAHVSSATIDGPFIDLESVFS